MRSHWPKRMTDDFNESEGHADHADHAAESHGRIHRPLKVLKSGAYFYVR